MLLIWPLQFYQLFNGHFNKISWHKLLYIYITLKEFCHRKAFYIFCGPVQIN